MPRVKNFENEIKKQSANPHEGHRERQRRKIDFDSELETFADHEILELRLGLVIPRRDTNELAHKLIDTFGSLDGVLTATPKELFEVKGMTMSAAYMLATDLAFVRKALRGVAKRPKRYAGSAESCIKTVYSYFIGRKTECLCVAFVDVNYNVIRINFHISESSSEVGINITDITKRAIREGAFGVILAHNHPNGTLAPSKEDILATEELLYTLSAANIQLIDHIIIKNKAIFSFNNNGILGKFRSEFAKRNSKIMASDNSVQLYFGNLDEYVIDPRELKNNVIRTMPKDKMIDELYKYEKDDELEKKKLEIEFQKTLDSVIVNSVVFPDAYKAINDIASMEEAMATANGNLNDDRIVTYEIDPDEIF